MLARGIDPRPVVPNRDARSIGAECTYDDDLTTRASIARTLLAHASRVAERLTEAHLAAGAIVVKLKYADFSILTRRMTPPEPVSDTTTIHEICMQLVDRFPLDDGRTRVRLTGVAAHELTPAGAVQATLFPDRAAERRRSLESVLLSAKGRFGGQPITFATLVDNSHKRSPKS